MPKTKAKGQDAWLRDAAAIIKKKNFDDLDYTDQQTVINAIENPKQNKAAYRKAERIFKKNEGDFKSAQETKRKWDRLDKLTDFEKYERLAGEAEARNVQTRMDYTPEQRKAAAPWTTLDVPENELIVRGNSNGQK